MLFIITNPKGISICFVSQGLKTLHDKGEENPIAKLIISILGVVAEMGKRHIYFLHQNGMHQPFQNQIESV